MNIPYVVRAATIWTTPVLHLARTDATPAANGRTMCGLPWSFGDDVASPWTTHAWPHRDAPVCGKCGRGARALLRRLRLMLGVYGFVDWDVRL